MHECATLAKIDTTDKELVDVEAQESPNIVLFARKANEVVNLNGADPAAVGGLHIRSSSKHPSPGALTHSVDAPAEAQRAASITSEASMLSNRSTSDRQFGTRDSARNQEIITILHPSPGASNRPMDSVSTGKPGSLTNAAWGRSEHRRRIGDKEMARNFATT